MYTVGVPLALLLFLLRSRMQQRPGSNRRRYGNRNRRGKSSERYEEEADDDDDDDGYEHLHALRFWYAVRERVFNGTVGGGSAVIEYSSGSSQKDSMGGDETNNGDPTVEAVHQQSLSLALYRPKWWFAEVCFLAQKLLLGGVFVLVEPHSPVQALCGTLLCVCFMVFVAHGRPFADDLNNSLSTVTNGHLTLTMAFGMWVLASRAVDSAGTVAGHSGGFDEKTASDLLLCAYAFVSAMVAVPLLCSVHPKMAHKILTFIWKHLRSCGEGGIESTQRDRAHWRKEEEEVAAGIEVEWWLWGGYAGAYAADYADDVTDDSDDDYDDYGDTDGPNSTPAEEDSSDSDFSDDSFDEQGKSIDFGFGFDSSGPMLPPQRMMLLDKFSGYNSNTNGFGPPPTKALVPMPTYAAPAQMNVLSNTSPPMTSPPTSHAPLPIMGQQSALNAVRNSHTPVTNAMMVIRQQQQQQQQQQQNAVRAGQMTPASFASRGGSIVSSVGSGNSASNSASSGVDASPAHITGLGYRQRLLMQLSRGRGGNRAQRRLQQRQPPSSSSNSQGLSNGKDAYDELLRLALVDGVLDPRENEQLAMARQKHNISLQCHNQLVSQLISEARADGASGDADGGYYDDDGDEGSYYEPPASPASAVHPSSHAPVVIQPPQPPPQPQGRQVRFTLLPSPSPSPQQQPPVRFGAVEQRIRSSTHVPYANV
jgi:hypothetical protein